MMNVALHGLEEAAGVRYQTSGSGAGDTRPDSPVVIRYADDLVACAHSREQAEQTKARLAEWLAPRGLVFNDDKTKIVHLTEGFDFLGFNVRRYRNGKLLITPSPAAVKRLRKRLADEMRALRGSNAAAVIAALTPIIRGRSSGAGLPTTGGWCPARPSGNWTTTHGSSPGGGPNAATPGNRRGGSPTVTSAGSTSSETTDGCSGTAAASTNAAASRT
jgi:RNA-directed DNA polymerase